MAEHLRTEDVGPITGDHEDFFTIGWWNGGGGVRKRLIVNPGLKEFISTKPDIWTYSESGITNSQSLPLDGYKYFLHRSYLRDKSNVGEEWCYFIGSNTPIKLLKFFLV